MVDVENLKECGWLMLFHSLCGLVWLCGFQIKAGLSRFGVPRADIGLIDSLLAYAGHTKRAPGTTPHPQHHPLHYPQLSPAPLLTSGLSHLSLHGHA